MGWLIGPAMKLMLSTISSAVDGAAAEALRLTASMLTSTTSPGLLSTWFSTTYWRMAALSALLTLPFLFAAAVHALVRSDLALLSRAAFGYLPLAAIGVTIAAPLATLLLSATDEMCSLVAGAAGNADGAALTRAASGVAVLSAMAGSPMLAFFIGLLAILATIGLWIELLIRAAAVDVIVLMLPLFFAAMVWPARRVWAIRAVETLIALILSKFAIVAVLTLGGAAIGSQSAGLTSTLVGATLIVLATISPWALLRLLPLHEVAAAAAGGLSQAPRAVVRGAGGTWYDGVRAAVGATGGAASAADGGPTPDGLGAEDDVEQTTAHRVAAGATGSRSFDASTLAGLAAVERAGRRAAHVAGFGPPGGSAGTYGPAPGDALLAQRRRDDRPPISAPFGPGEWEPFVLGEEGDEVMEPPRFVDEPGLAPDAGADREPARDPGPDRRPDPGADRRPEPDPAPDPGVEDGPGIAEPPRFEDGPAGSAPA